MDLFIPSAVNVTVSPLSHVLLLCQVIRWWLAIASVRVGQPGTSFRAPSKPDYYHLFYLMLHSVPPLVIMCHFLCDPYLSVHHLHYHLWRVTSSCLLNCNLFSTVRPLLIIGHPSSRHPLHESAHSSFSPGPPSRINNHADSPSSTNRCVSLSHSTPPLFFFHGVFP